MIETLKVRGMAKKLPITTKKNCLVLHWCFLCSCKHLHLPASSTHPQARVLAQHKRYSKGVPLRWKASSSSDTVLLIGQLCLDSQDSVECMLIMASGAKHDQP